MAPGVEADNFKVFPLSLEKLEWLAQAAKKYGNTTNGQRKCHGCDRVAPAKDLTACGKCKHFYYCGKV
jgi:uncharacterized paraquat-inducible protein A